MFRSVVQSLFSNTSSLSSNEDNELEPTNKGSTSLSPARKKTKRSSTVSSPLFTVGKDISAHLPPLDTGPLLPLEANLDTGILLPLEANEAAEKDITLIPTVVNLELIDMA